jgi:hypothetical protein
MILKHRLILAIYLMSIWCVFILGAFVALVTPLIGIVLILVHPTHKLERVRNIILSVDRLNAAILGFSGLRTISGECGLSQVSNTPCAFCANLCKILSIADPNHCTNAALSERTLP